MAKNSSDILRQTVAFIKGLSAGKLFVLISLLGAVLTSILFLMIWSNEPDFQILFSNLTPEDAGAIVNDLKDQKVPYQISSNGSSILVPKNVIYETRLQMANQGLPKGSGIGFEIFDTTKLGMTEFVQNVNYQRALQGELSRTINGFDEVEGSRVHIVMPAKSLFIEDETHPTASVVIKLKKGKRLSENQIKGIVHLVSSSVSGLRPEDITIVDNNGKMLAGSEENSADGQLSSNQLEYQEKVERSLEKRIESMLEKVLGPEKAIVRISCSFDFRRHEKTEEVYDPEGKVIRSEQDQSTVSNKTERASVGVPGVASNMPNENKTSIPQGEAVLQGPEYQKKDRTVNYEIGKVTNHIVEPIGRMERLSVAVVVDGTLQAVKAEEDGEEDGKEQLKYIPRTTEELEKITGLVKRAVNFDAERGDEIEVVNIQFENKGETESEEEIGDSGLLSSLEQYTQYLKYVLFVMFIVFTFLFIIRPLVKWLTSSAAIGTELVKQLPMTVEEIERGYGEGRKSLPFRDQALAMLKGEDKSSLDVAREWLTEK
ncbi:Flagellar M-ring protein [uncultured Desulfobacterium sp.]|uniref:Flagellar M-ring protein n=1 Tax=uncultured Desulfobacterium sp. TaxID=201089 RepID=A0A445MTF4_9BACT|nr:Flagellar M-ring protein [uncultured Desulfobacterium sp.]